MLGFGLQVLLCPALLGMGRPSSRARSSRHGCIRMSMEPLGPFKQDIRSSRLKVTLNGPGGSMDIRMQPCLEELV